MPLLLCGCADREPDPLNSEVEQIIAYQPGITEGCKRKLREGSLNWTQFDQPDCYEMLPARTWKGHWDLGFEWTDFSCLAVSRDCPMSPKDGDVWLEFGDGVSDKIRPTDGLYEIAFVGRRTKTPAHFGHLGQYEHLMVVDRLISVRKVEKESKAEDQAKR